MPGAVGPDSGQSAGEEQGTVHAAVPASRGDRQEKEREQQRGDFLAQTEHERRRRTEHDLPPPRPCCRVVCCTSGIVIAGENMIFLFTETRLKKAHDVF